MTDRKTIAAEIQARHLAGERLCNLAREFNLAPSTTWNYAHGTRVPGRICGKAYPIEKVVAIKSELAAGVKPLAVAVEHGVSESTVKHYQLGRRRKDVAA
ncbi:MAG TPA: hypothetical protein VGK73_31585 [Polyangiaceae bacterium]